MQTDNKCFNLIHRNRTVIHNSYFSATGFPEEASIVITIAIATFYTSIVRYLLFLIIVQHDFINIFFNVFMKRFLEFLFKVLCQSPSNKVGY